MEIQTLSTKQFISNDIVFEFCSMSLCIKIEMKNKYRNMQTFVDSSLSDSTTWFPAQAIGNGL